MKNAADGEHDNGQSSQIRIIKSERRVNDLREEIGNIWKKTNDKNSADCDDSSNNPVLLFASLVRLRRCSSTPLKISPKLDYQEDCGDNDDEKASRRGNGEKDEVIETLLFVTAVIGWTSVYVQETQKSHLVSCDR